MSRTLCREARLLWLTARGDNRDESIRELVRAGLDWRRLTWLTEVERAAPIVYGVLDRAVGRDALPPDANALRRLAMVERLHLQLTAERLEQAVERLGAEGIRPALLKGAAMAVAVYGSFDERPMIDIDLLVDAARLNDAHRALVEAGWRSTATPLSAQFYARHQHLPVLVSGAGDHTRLELHGSLLAPDHPFAIDEHELWAGARPTAIGGAEVLIPASEWLLLHACLHFAWSHAMGRGAWRTFRDIDAVRRHDATFAWEAFAALAMRAGAVGPSYWTLRLARLLAGLEVPSATLAALRPRQPEWTLRMLERHFAFRLSHAADSCPSVSVDRKMWRWAAGWRMPARSEPWRHGEEFPNGAAAIGDAPPDEERRERMGAGARLLRHARQLGGWGRYLHTLAMADPQVRSGSASPPGR